MYFYKVLEYFFIISQKENIKNNIDQYNKGLDIDALITIMYDEYLGKKEDLLLHSLIDSTDCDLMNEIRSFAISNSLITKIITILYVTSYIYTDPLSMIVIPPGFFFLPQGIFFQDLLTIFSDQA